MISEVDLWCVFDFEGLRSLEILKKKKKKKTIAFPTVRLLHIPKKKNFQNGLFWTRGKIDHQF